MLFPGRLKASVSKASTSEDNERHPHGQDVGRFWTIVTFLPFVAIVT
jgi:hypothetical protein